MQSHSAHSPTFREKAPFREKRFTTKVLDTTPKLPLSIPLARSFPKKKLGSEQTPFPSTPLKSSPL
nr:hypothetical protein [uncultured bacterium]